MTNTALPASIDIEHVLALGNVDQSLASFYGDAVAAAAVSSGVPERTIRDWVEDELISEQGFRTQALTGPDPAGPAVLLALENAHLIRSDARRGAQWYELSHDRMVAPVRESNASWRAVNLSPLQLDAMAWDRQGRPKALLASGEVLSAAAAWAAANPGELMGVDREFVAASQENERGLLRARRASRRNRMLVSAALLLAVLTLAGGSVAYSRSRETTKLRTANAEATRQQGLAESSAAEAKRQQGLAESNAALAEASAREARKQRRSPIATPTGL